MEDQPPAPKARHTPTVFVVDDEVPLLNSIERMLQSASFHVKAFSDPTQVIPAMDTIEPDVVLTDIRMPGLDGIQLCRDLKKTHPDVEVVVMTGVGSIQDAVEAMRAGAYDFLTKPFESLDVVPLSIGKACERKRLLSRTKYLEEQVDIRDRFENIIGSSGKMKDVFRMIQGVAPVDSTVLILGESGTGKELVARAIHERSGRRARRFVAVNCSAFTESLLESELFGHTKGAFTGATQYRKGIFEEADEGTVFLDEIAEMTPATQVKLLRVLQEGEIKPVGASDSKKVNVRVIAATNVDLPEAVKEGKFREDLFYRINVVPISLPPLRDRVEDIPLLVDHFLRKYSAKVKKGNMTMASKSMALLVSYRWPGNVRELENTIERVVVLSASDQITPEILPENIQSISDPNTSAALPLLEMPFAEARQQVLASFDKRYIEDVLARSGGIVAEAARLAQMDRSNFRRLMKQYGVDSSDFRQD